MCQAGREAGSRALLHTVSMSSDDDYDRNPVGFLGWLRNRKGLAWIVIIGLVLLTVGGSAILFFVQQAAGQ